MTPTNLLNIDQVKQIISKLQIYLNFWFSKIRKLLRMKSNTV